MANKRYSIYKRPDTKKRVSRKKLLFTIFGFVVLLSGTVLALELTNTTHLFHKKTNNPAPTAGQSTKGEVSGSSSKTAQTAPTGSSSVDTPSSSSTQPGDQKSNTQTGSTTNLTAPSGDFVSAHHVTLNTAISSVCNTTSGANCQIVFTQGSTTQQLTSQTTDRGGSTYWNSWTPKSIGLTPGTWSIQAVATLNGQTKTAADALNLVVSQ